MQQVNPTGQARIGFKQSILKSAYLMQVFMLLCHYCKSYPKLGFAKLNGKIYPFLQFTTRSLSCFTELYNLFYTVNLAGKMVKGVPKDIYNMLTLPGLAH